MFIMNNQSTTNRSSTPHLLEILKIIEGAITADLTKVSNYVEQLAAKVEADGDTKGAERLRSSLSKSKFAEVTAARVVQKLPVDSDSRLTLADEHVFKAGDVKIFLSPKVKASTDEFIRFVKSADRLTRQGVGISPSLMMYGPPGCGKTELSHYIGAELGLPVLTARVDALVSSFLGNTSKNLRVLFEHAMARPCVLFLDEMDSIGKLRDDRHELGELKRVVVSLLQNIDALHNETVLLAATNHEHLLDSAIWRRFAFKVKIDKPDENNRNQMASFFLANYATPQNIKVCSELTEGLSGSDIKQICEDSIRYSILSGAEHVCSTELMKRIVSLKLPELETFEVEEQLKMVRDLSPKLFTYRRLRDLLGVSTGFISNVLGEATNA
jgi:hypothetical protein